MPLSVLGCAVIHHKKTAFQPSKSLKSPTPDLEIFLRATCRMSSAEDAAWRLSELSKQELQDAVVEIFKRSWNETVLVQCTIFYIFILPLSRWALGYGANYQRNKDFWKFIMKSYNLLMSLFSLLVFVAGARALYRTPLYTEDCGIMMRDPVWNTAVYAFYVSKYVEYADTFFIYLMDKPVSFLQWYHHIGAAMSLAFFILYSSENAWIFTVFNSFIHTIMYYYFSLTVMNPDPKTKKKLEAFRPVMTAMQLCQFIFGCLACYAYRNVRCFTSNTAHFLASYYFPYTYVYGLMALFTHFFLEQYVCRDKHRPKSREFSAPADELLVNGKANGKKHE
eukprot:g81543.t1